MKNYRNYWNAKTPQRKWMVFGLACILAVLVILVLFLPWTSKMPPSFHNNGDHGAHINRNTPYLNVAASAAQYWISQGCPLGASRATPRSNAAAEAAIGLAILVVYFRNRGSIAVEDINMMKG